MNTLIQFAPYRTWNPYKEMEDLSQRLSSLLQTAASRPGVPTGDKENLIVAEWTPLVDITEDDSEYLIKLELPEVRKEDVTVTVENGVLSVAGERKAEREEKNRRYHRIERGYGRFVRNFSLPEDADGSKVVANFKDGLLRVHVAKQEKARPRSIEVKVA